MNSTRKLLQAAAFSAALAGAAAPAFAGEADAAASRSVETHSGQQAPSSYALHSALYRAPTAQQHHR